MNRQQQLEQMKLLKLLATTELVVVVEHFLRPQIEKCSQALMRLTLREGDRQPGESRPTLVWGRTSKQSRPRVTRRTITTIVVGVTFENNPSTNCLPYQMQQLAEVNKIVLSLSVAVKLVPNTHDKLL